MRLISDNGIAIATIYQEAAGEPYEGKIAVGEVIRTRMQNAKCTATEVCLAPVQFSGWNARTADGKLNFYRTKTLLIDPSEDQAASECVQAWADSSMTNLTRGATHYVNMKLASPTWLQSMELVTTIGNHSFFKMKGVKV